MSIGSFMTDNDLPLSRSGKGIVRDGSLKSSAGLSNFRRQSFHELSLGSILSEWGDIDADDYVPDI